jgi:hypothetical protein
MASGDNINYTIRPAKFVERKIIRDMLFKVDSFQSISSYKYIGFGSKYFTDFNLFHKSLHIDDMTSIEGDVENSIKYEFNKPFDCIDVQMGNSNEVLNRLEFNKNFIAWLDYDYGFNESMLIDIEILMENIHSGSVAIISYNSIAHKIGNLRDEFKDEDSTHKELLIKKLAKLIPEQYIPSNIPEQGLAKADNYSKIVREIFQNKINNFLIDKNSALTEGEKWKFEQFIFFQYKDGTDMGTLGWIFYQEKDKQKFEACKLETSEFYRGESEFYKISIPNFTVKELNKLQNMMPLKGEVDRTNLPVEIYLDEDIISFSQIYKYYPSFMNVDFA